MNVLRFQARSSAEAIRQIRAQLGEEAVVLSVTPLPAKGLGRLWRRPGLEVLAGLPEEAPEQGRGQGDDGRGQMANGRGPAAGAACLEPEAQAAAESRSAPVLGRSNVHLSGDPEPIQRAEPLAACCARGRARSESVAEGYIEPLSSASPEVPRFQFPTVQPTSSSSRWRTAALLQQMGLQPLCIDQVLDRVRATQGEEPPAAFAEEFALVKDALSSLWQTPPAVPRGFPAIHVFVGPPGSGKTTVLCKWLAKSVLVERQTPRAWRLDSRTANFAGLLDFYGEILNVPLEREWRGVTALPGFDLGFVDLPGTNPQDGLALQQLRTRLQAVPAAQVHLVLNAAYEVPVLLAQIRAFAGLPVSDLILTHLDEEKRRGKLWNLVLGTNIAVRFLSGGQNIPGDFSPATPEQLFSR